MATLAPTYLRCEYRIDPLGIDAPQPRLSWILQSGGRGRAQTAYRVVVADSRDALEAEDGNLWDSGKVPSDRSAHVVYGGHALGSGMRCYWRVRVWDHGDNASEWSDTALWTMGLLAPGDRTAPWIGHDAPYAAVAGCGQIAVPGRPDTSVPSWLRVAKIFLRRLIAVEGDSHGVWPGWARNLLRAMVHRYLVPLLSRRWLHRVARTPLVLPACPYLRRDFTVANANRATVYASALGLYELHVNGQRVGADCLTPGWTDYARRIHYQTYDVTPLLREGRNTIGAILADGWYAGYLGPGRRRAHYGLVPRLFVRLHVDHADGTAQVIASDAAWTASTGPHVEADLLMGETYDARAEMPGWSEPGYDDSAWSPADVTETVPARLRAMPHGPVRRVGEVKPVGVSEPTPGCFIFDMGGNFAGWVRLRARGQAGTRVRLRFGERLERDGTLYTENLRGARATDTYILKGEGEEVWEPRFTYHGFQYVEVTGYPGKPDRDAITGVAIHSDAPMTGSFECSNHMVTTLYGNIVRTQRANFVEVPTDCSQRDERLGWLGDAQIFMRAATYNMDVASFFTKWLADVRDAQSGKGAFPDFAPRATLSPDGSPAWGDAGVICPWVLYSVYGDTRLLAVHFSAMKRWIDYIDEGNPDHIWTARAGNNNGEWLPIDNGTPKEVFATAYFAHSTRLLAGMAAALGRGEDARRYEDLFARIKQAFNESFVSADGHVKGATQSCYVLALHFDLLPQTLRQSAAHRLVEDIRRRGGHLSTGFFGTGYLLAGLTAAGYLDVAYELLTKETFPSWGYSIRRGATSVWERWDGWTEKRGFQSPVMNSFSHYAFGAVAEWLFSAVAGIDTDGPGYERIVIRPRPGGGLTWARAHYDSIHGRIATHWRQRGERFELDVTIPANTRATVYLPASGPERVHEGGEPLSATGDVEIVGFEDGEAILQIESGDYRFAVDRT